MDTLILIDLQRDFVDPGGALYFPGAEKVVPPAVNLVEKYKAGNLPVITTQDWHQVDDLEFDRFPRHCVAGSAGAQLTEQVASALAGYGNHYAIRKTRYSAFYNTDLEQLLARLQPTLVEVAGVVTNICVLHTVEELRNRDIAVRVHSAAVASFSIEHHHFALEHMQKVLGAEVI